MSIQRKIKRKMLKNELGTNEISEEYHKRYGYKPNISKLDLKLKARKERAKKKENYKKARLREREN